MYRFVIKKTYAILLMSLKEGEKEIKECAAKIGVHHGHLRVVLDSWHKQGIIHRDRNFTNAYKLSLSEKGKMLVEALEKVIHIIDNVPADHKTTEELMEGINADKNMEILEQRRRERDQEKKDAEIRKAQLAVEAEKIKKAAAEEIKKQKKANKEANK